MASGSHLSCWYAFDGIFATNRCLVSTRSQEKEALYLCSNHATFGQYYCHLNSSTLAFTYSLNSSPLISSYTHFVWKSCSVQSCRVRFWGRCQYHYGSWTQECIEGCWTHVRRLNCWLDFAPAI